MSLPNWLIFFPELTFQIAIDSLEIGCEIDPGVPWTFTRGEPALALALKSGNFGRVDFFRHALEQLRPDLADQ